MSPTTRRSFLKTGLAAGAMATIGTLPLGAAKRTATDTAVLGRSNMEVTRLAFGTGTDGGAVQAALGQQEFTRLVRYAYDHGIRFFETAEAYQTPGMLGEALGGAQPRLWRAGGDPTLPGRRPVVAPRRHPRPLRRGTPSSARRHPADVHGPDPGPLGHHPHLWPAIQNRSVLQAGPPRHRCVCLPLLDGGHDATTARERRS